MFTVSILLYVFCCAYKANVIGLLNTSFLVIRFSLLKVTNILSRGQLTITGHNTAFRISVPSPLPSSPSYLSLSSISVPLPQWPPQLPIPLQLGYRWVLSSPLPRCKVQASTCPLRIGSCRLRQCTGKQQIHVHVHIALRFFS